MGERLHLAIQADLLSGEVLAEAMKKEYGDKASAIRPSCHPLQKVTISWHSETRAVIRQCYDRLVRFVAITKNQNRERYYLQRSTHLGDQLEGLNENREPSDSERDSRLGEMLAFRTFGQQLSILKSVRPDSKARSVP